VSRENLNEEGGSHDKSEFLQVNDLICGSRELQPRGDLAYDDNDGDGHGEPLQTEENEFPQGRMFIRGRISAACNKVRLNRVISVTNPLFLQCKGFNGSRTG